MADDVFQLFDDYAARFARGERPDAQVYLARAGEGADELSALIDRYLESAPAPAPDDDEVALAAAWAEDEPPLLTLRNRRGLRRDEVVDSLIGALALDRAKRDKVKDYYHQLETGQLELRRVDRRVFDVLAETLRARFDDVRAWRARPFEAQTTYARLDALADDLRLPTVPKKPEERDEIDVLFLGEPNGP
jgi:hypothetical protein